MDTELKKQVTKTLDALGLNFNTFVVMAAKQLVNKQAIPFELSIPKAPEMSPYARKISSMYDIALKEGKVAEGTPVYATVAEFKKALNEGDDPEAFTVDRNL